MLKHGCSMGEGCLAFVLLEHVDHQEGSIDCNVMALVQIRVLEVVGLMELTMMISIFTFSCDPLLAHLGSKETETVKGPSDGHRARTLQGVNWPSFANQYPPSMMRSSIR